MRQNPHRWAIGLFKNGFLPAVLVEVCAADSFECLSMAIVVI